MTYDAKSRDRYRWAVTGVTGALTASVFLGTGAISGQAARDLNQTEAAEQAQQAEEFAAWQAEQARYERELEKAERREARRVIVKTRPTATRVTTRYVNGAAPSGGVSVSAGRTPSGGGQGTSGSGGKSNSGGGGGGGGGGGTPAPPPPPPPPPASSGS